jgi:hypothetical protein
VKKLKSRLKQKPFTISLFIASVLFASHTLGNDVEPRLYSNVPVGVNFVSIGYGNSQGEVTFDSSVPLDDGDGDVDSLFLSYSRGLDIAGKSALLSIALPYADLGLTGVLYGESASGRRKGLGDPRIRLAMNFYGAPATQLKDYIGYQQKTIVGVSVSVGMPFGRYLDDKLLNISANRWNVITQVGVSHSVKRFTFESAVGVSVFTDNDEVLGARRLEQDPIGLWRGTLLYHFPKGSWIGTGFVYSNGGATTLEGVQRDDRQDNWRTGLTFSYPVARGHNIQLRVTEGVVARTGADFRTYSASYTYTF